MSQGHLGLQTWGKQLVQDRAEEPDAQETVRSSLEALACRVLACRSEAVIFRAAG